MITDNEVESLDYDIAVICIVGAVLILLKCKHPLVTALAIISVALSIGTTQFMTYYVLDIHYYPHYNLLTLFVFIPISCDNIFYFVQILRQNYHSKYFKNKDRVRITYVFRKFLHERGIPTVMIVLSLIACSLSAIKPI